ncbi:MAG: RloB family protein [Treponema sp.]
MTRKHHETRSVVLIRKPRRIRQLRRILIVCEGEKTEPNYFKAFPANPVVYDGVDIKGIGNNTVFVVNEAVRLRDEAEKNGEPYIEVWVVFDKDDFPQADFEEAVAAAAKNRIKCAYSIESFEIWYLLHFNYYDTGMSRSDYIEKLSVLLKKTYTKNDETMYKTLSRKMKVAIKNASTLYNRQCGKPFADRNPVTLVFQLVERLTEK